MDQRVCREFYGHEVVRRFCIRPVGSGMVLDVQLLAVNQDPQVTEILVVIAFERHTIFTVGQRLLHHRDAYRWGALVREFRYGMAAVAGDKEWGFTSVRASCEALIVVGMTRQHRMRPDTRFRASRVNIRQHERAAAVPAHALRTTALDLGDIRRMMGGYNHRALELVALDTLQRGF